MKLEHKFWKLIQKLHQKTSAGTLTWEATPSINFFQAALPNYSVSIAEIEGAAAPEPDYLLTLYDEHGKSIERITDVQIAESYPQEERSNVPAFRTMMDLYSMARRNALGVDKAIDSLLANLEEDPDFP